MRLSRFMRIRKNENLHMISPNTDTDPVLLLKARLMQEHNLQAHINAIE